MSLSLRICGFWKESLRVEWIFSTVLLLMGPVDMGHEDLSVRWLQSLKSEMSSWIFQTSCSRLE